jgi:hypothetical protein
MSKTTSFVLENINTTELEKKHILNEDMLMSSLRNSPKTKRTRIKDIFSSVENKDFELKQKKDHIKETNNINFYISMNGKMIKSKDLDTENIHCFHCHKSLDCIPMTVPIRFHPSKIKSEYIRPTKFFEEDAINVISSSSICMSKKDREHPDCEHKDYYEGIGVVCSFECAIGHAKMRLLCGDRRFSNSYFLISKMYFSMFKKPMVNIKERPMFCYELTKRYGGMCEDFPKELINCKYTFSGESLNDLPTFKISSSIYQELKK